MRSVHYEVMKRCQLDFVYAAFFPIDNGRVLVKFGRSQRPYARVKQIAENSPYELKQAVFTQAGDKAISTAIEKAMFYRLSKFRTRGEWYEFGGDEGSMFALSIKEIFAKITGRQLKWSSIDVSALREEGRIAAAKFHGRILHERIAKPKKAA